MIDKATGVCIWLWIKTVPEQEFEIGNEGFHELSDVHALYSEYLAASSKEPCPTLMASTIIEVSVRWHMVD